jgi:hypothetical protein
MCRVGSSGGVAANSDEDLIGASILLIRGRLATPTPREIVAATLSPSTYTGAAIVMRPANSP